VIADTLQVRSDLVRAGLLLKIEVLDHVIMGRDRHISLRAQGYFAT
jgi:DNA repair protein RadC